MKKYEVIDYGTERMIGTIIKESDLKEDEKEELLKEGIIMDLERNRNVMQYLYLGNGEQIHQAAKEVQEIERAERLAKYLELKEEFEK